MGANEGLESVKLRAPEISALFRLLSHPSRLRIALALMGGEITVNSIAEKSGVAQPALSRDLGRFRALGLVATRRVSREIYYSLTDKRLPDLLVALGDAF